MIKKPFDEIYQVSGYATLDEFGSIKSGMIHMYNKKEQELDALIKRIENLPCCMSCYITQDEQRAAQNMKDWIIEILKGEKQ
ncbi:TPA: hypothetical protein PFD71_003193 [Vibrio cholerae]|nr:hypothetical protein [Vibrio cholerae]